MKLARLGIMGGSFNPIHHGHLIAADRACEQLRLDRVLFIPTALSPLKDVSDLAPAEHRMAMVRLAIREHPKFKALDIEITRGGLSYTFDTVAALKTSADIFIIIGDDAVGAIPRWYRIHDLATRVTFAVVARPGRFEPAPPGPWKLRRVRTPLIEISGSEIRQRAAREASIRYLVPSAVEKYIRTHKLYR
ncbi:MAG: nicotinate (nicotinamide) nucleotide adenylyltransferase [Planctomycetes bacterium]|nr:nicotinate (nicotinamide) nucleotide adenylyltransferase [Planctomycetota bacterium]